MTPINQLSVPLLPSSLPALTPAIFVGDWLSHAESVLEIDTRFGEYNLCNPDPQTGEFECVSPSEMGHETVAGCPGTVSIKGQCFPGQPVETITATVPECCALAKRKGLIDQIWNHYSNNTCAILDARQMGSNNRPVPCADGQLGYIPAPNQTSSVCWYNNPQNPQWVEEFGADCSRDNCTCDAVSKRAVGREFLAETMGMGGSAKCTSAIFAKCGAFQGKNDTKACEVCVEVASQALMRDHTCTQQGLGIALFELCSPPVPGGGGGGSGASGSQALMLDKVIPLAQRLNGSWYSTEAEGECVGDARPGDGSGCYWRLLENTRIVNASCVNGRC